MMIPFSRLLNDLGFATAVGENEKTNGITRHFQIFYTRTVVLQRGRVGGRRVTDNDIIKLRRNNY